LDSSIFKFALKDFPFANPISQYPRQMNGKSVMEGVSLNAKYYELNKKAKKRL
jgi:hypothetical protein